MHIPPGFANVRLMFRHFDSGNDAITGFGVGLESADPPEVLDDIATLWGTTFGPEMSGIWEGEDIQLVVGTSDPTAPLVFTHGAWEGGSGSFETLPPNVATIIEKRTALGGRKGRGRMFIPSPGEAGVDNKGHFSSSQLAFLQTQCNEFLAGVNGISGVTEMVLLHTDPSLAPTTITSLVPKTLIGQQVRRLR